MSGIEIIKHKDGTEEKVKVRKKVQWSKPDPNRKHGEILKEKK